MRITKSMITNKQVKSISSNLEKVSVASYQVSSGEKYSRPSDNPTEVMKIMKLQTEMEYNTQYETNMTDSIAKLSYMETSLDSAVDAMQSFKETFDSKYSNRIESNEIASNIMSGLVETMAGLFNSSSSEGYYFTGSDPTIEPFTISYNGAGDAIGFTYNGNNEIANTEIDDGVYINYGITGQDILGSASGSGNNLSQTLAEAINMVDTDNFTNFETIASEIDDHLDNLLFLQGTTGTNTNRLTAAKDTHDAIKLDMTAYLTELEGVDTEQAIIDFSTYQTVYDANISASSSVLKMISLMDVIN